MNPEQLFVLCLATWRIANLLVNEHGPFEVFDGLRGLFGILLDPATDEKKLLDERNEIGKMLLCVWCTSIWVAALWLTLYLLLPVPIFIVSLGLSMSAVSCLLDRYNEGS